MNTVKIKDRKFSFFLSAKQIQDTVKQIAEQMNNDLAGKDVVFVVVLNGAFVFAADLLRWIEFQVQVSFIKISSYEGVSSSGKVKTILDLNEEIRGRHVVLIEDIVDTGLSLQSILNQLEKKEPGKVQIASLFFKPDSFRGNTELDYIGFRIPNRFVVGYGLDYMGYGRNLTGLYALEDG